MIKLDKKVIIVLAAIIVVLIVAGAGFYNYATKTEESNLEIFSPEEINQEPNQPDNTPKIEIPEGGIKVEGGNGDSGGGGLIICLDKCGDGICQTADPDCDMNKSLNCTCPENQQECPQDCK
jgi:hypothetical protein